MKKKEMEHIILEQAKQINQIIDVIKKMSDTQKQIVKIIDNIVRGEKTSIDALREELNDAILGEGEQ